MSRYTIFYSTEDENIPCDSELYESKKDAFEAAKDFSITEVEDCDYIGVWDEEENCEVAE